MSAMKCSGPLLGPAVSSSSELCHQRLSVRLVLGRASLVLDFKPSPLKAHCTSCSVSSCPAAGAGSPVSQVTGIRPQSSHDVVSSHKTNFQPTELWECSWSELVGELVGDLSLVQVSHFLRTGLEA